MHWICLAILHVYSRSRGQIQEQVTDEIRDYAIFWSEMSANLATFCR